MGGTYFFLLERRAISSQKIATLRFETSQENGLKIHASSHTSRSKIHSNGLEQALKENQNPFRAVKIRSTFHVC